jgi:hypothetical protein
MNTAKSLPVRALRPGPYKLSKPVKNERPDRRSKAWRSLPEFPVGTYLVAANRRGLTLSRDGNEVRLAWDSAADPARTEMSTKEICDRMITLNAGLLLGEQQELAPLWCALQPDRSPAGQVGFLLAESGCLRAIDVLEELASTPLGMDILRSAATRAEANLTGSPTITHG